MRRLLKSIAKGEQIGDVSTLENEAAVGEIQAVIKELKLSMKKQ